jgi:hypothetical protein
MEKGKNMSIRAFTDDAAGLLVKIKKLIDQGHVATWEYDDDGDYTHTASGGQWKGKAWLRPQVQSDKLRFVIVKTEGVPLVREIYAVYQGRFIEMLIAHVASKFTSVTATPNPVSGDEPALEG